MWKEKLPTQEGMLFLYEQPQIVNIWMHNTYIPLDIIFIDESIDKKVLKSEILLSKKVIASEKKVIAVLELPKNCSKKININIGDKISWEFIQPSKKKLIIVYPKIKSKIILGFKMGNLIDKYNKSDPVFKAELSEYTQNLKLENKEEFENLHMTISSLREQLDESTFVKAKMFKRLLHQRTTK